MATSDVLRAMIDETRRFVRQDLLPAEEWVEEHDDIPAPLGLRHIVRRDRLGKVADRDACRNQTVGIDNYLEFFIAAASDTDSCDTREQRPQLACVEAQLDNRRIQRIRC
jgi:hypothetical protein